MSTTIEQIRNVLKQKFGNINFELIDNSGLHKGHAGVAGGNYEVSHLKIIIPSTDIPGKTRLEKHKYLNEILKDYFQKIHSIEVSLV